VADELETHTLIAVPTQSASSFENA
jgi:hypothetical protein